MRNRNRTSTLVLISLIALILAIVGTVALIGYVENRTSVRIAYLPITVYLPLYIAQEKGFFADQRLETELLDLTISPYVVEASLADRADVVCASLPELLSAEQKAPGHFKIFMVFATDSDNPVDYILVRTDSPMASLTDLRDKRMAVFPGKTNLLFVKMMLRDQVSLSEIELTQDIPPANHIAALVTEQVDALYTLDPIATIAMENGVAKPLVISVRENYVQEARVGGACAFSSRYMREHPKQAVRIVTALEQAVDYIREEGTEAKRLLSLYTSTPSEIAPLINPAAIWKLDGIDRQAVQTLADMLYREGFLDQPVDTTHMYYQAR